MKVPPYIKTGSKIHIVSPAGKMDEKYVMPAVEWLTEQGYKVELGKHVFARHFQFAGTDEQRLDDLQTAMDDPETDVILCSRGGYGTVRIIDKLDFTNFQKKPKWLVGFSDITVLHSCLNNLRVASIHGAMPRYFFNDNGLPNENLTSLMQVLSGEEISYNFSTNNKNRMGSVTAELTGGNLSLITSQLGTRFDIETNGKILFLEEIDEYLYHTDRMIRQLKLAGKLDKLAGLIIGDFTDMKNNASPFGENVHEIISEAVKEFDYPVAFDFPAGHDKRNLALTFGQTWQLDISKARSTLKLL